MSKRTLGDYIRHAFLMRDKASVDALIKDAEENGVDPEDGHQEPDGDEGKHASNVHVHIEHGSNGNGDSKTKDADENEKRLKGCEDGIKKLGDKMTRLFDHLGVKDAEESEEDKKKREEKEAADAKAAKDAANGGEEGAQTAEKLTTAEPELMEADPALKTGRSMMGDAAYVERVTKLVPALVQDMRARAEVLVPGIQMPTFDAKPGHATQDAICAFRRNALTQALTTDKGAKAIAGGYTADAIKAMSCDAVRMLFNDASQRMRDLNNGATMTHNPNAYRMPDMASYRQVQASRLAGINKANSDFWSKQTGRPN